VLDPASYTVVLLAGGTSRRMGGGDKTALELGAGRTVLGHLVSDLDTDVRVVVVGEERPLERSVTWAREEPPGGGPLAALAAGLAVVMATQGSEWTMVLAGDQPYAAGAVPDLLAAIGPEVDAVVGVDAAGRDQPLLAAYRCESAARAIAELPGGVRGRPARLLLESLRVRRIALPGETGLDVDDADGLARARRLLSGGPG
jgi:molybdopterin-guanine dinucleotide biosynthesis protein A